VAVTDAAWWGVWWPWMLVWSVTVTALVAAAAMAVLAFVHWQRHPRSRTLDFAFYLDEPLTMDTYKQMGLRPSVSRKVQHEVQSGSKRGLRIQFPGTSLGADKEHKSDARMLREYDENDEPITVIGPIMDTLEATKQIAWIDLGQEPLVQLKPSAEKTPDRSSGSPITLEDMRGWRCWFMISGVFEQNDSQLTFTATSGRHRPGQAAVRIEYRSVTGLRDEVPAGPFLGRCLGRVKDWDHTHQQLVVHAMAIFR